MPLRSCRPALVAHVARVALAVLPAALRAQAAAAPPTRPASGALARTDWAPDSLRADVDALGRVLVAFHPALTKYASRPDFDRRLATLRASFDRPTPPAIAVRRLAQFVTASRDGHTFLNPYNQGAFVRDTVLGGAARLPFTARVLAGPAPRTPAPRGPATDVLVVARDLTAARTGATGVLPPGTVVHALAGVPVATVLDSLATVSRGDGHTDALRRARLGVRDDQAAARLSDAPLDLYYALFFSPPGDSLHLTVRRPGARRDATVTVALLTQAERRARLAARAATAGRVRWRARRVDTRTALIAIPSFVTYGETHGDQAGAPPPTRWLDSTLAAFAAAGVDRLLLDVRGNVGGSTELAYAVARRLAVRPRGAPLPCDVIGRVLVAAPTPDTAAVHYAMSWRDDWTRPLPAGTWRASAVGRAELVAAASGAWPVYGRACEPVAAGERPVTWSGRTAVLADEANASATFLFLTLVRRHALATIVGRPAGGNQRGIDGGLVLFTRLPYSGVEVDVPFFAQEPTGPAPDGPLEPDVRVGWTAADVATGRDPDVTTARSALATAGPSLGSSGRTR